MLTFSMANHTLNYYNSNVRAEIESWPVGILADFAHVVELLMEFGPNLRMPHSRALGEGLFELRLRGREGSGRVLYCFAHAHTIVILHAFMKKSRRTPGHELVIARSRMRNVKNG